MLHILRVHRDFDQPVEKNADADKIWIHNKADANSILATGAASAAQGLEDQLANFAKTLVLTILLG